VNEYVTKFTQLSHYAPHEVDTDEKKHECFLNGLNDGLTYALEPQDFENFQGMVNKALVLKYHRGVMEHKHKLLRQHQSSSWIRILYPAASSDSTPQQSPYSYYWESECSEEPSYPRTHSKLIVGATTVVKRDIMPINALIRTLVLISPLQVHLPIPMEPTLFLLLPSRTTLMGESIMWPWKKHKKLLMLSLVSFSSMTLLQLCCLILEHRILSYLLHMLGSIICP
jgi:hypothetical protein